MLNILFFLKISFTKIIIMYNGIWQGCTCSVERNRWVETIIFPPLQVAANTSDFISSSEFETCPLRCEKWRRKRRRQCSIRNDVGASGAGSFTPHFYYDITFYVTMRVLQLFMNSFVQLSPAWYATAVKVLLL